MFPIALLLVRSEQGLLRDAFGDAYDDYCRKTRRFIPKL